MFWSADLGDINKKYATLINIEELAAHILMFLVKSICKPLSFSFASFRAAGYVPIKLCQFVWMAVCYLEEIIGETADGASPNRRFFRMNRR